MGLPISTCQSCTHTRIYAGNRRVRLLGTAPCRDYRRSNVTARRRGPVIRHEVDARMAAFSCAGRSRSLRRVASSARTRSTELVKSSASLLFSSTIVLSRSTSASSARILASRPESILGCTSGIGDATGGPRRAAIPDAFVSRLANSKAFWMYHHLHSSWLQRQGRKTSKQTKLLFANIPAQYSGHCSLTWLVPPWPGIAAEKRTKSLRLQSSVTKAGARLA